MTENPQVKRRIYSGPGLLQQVGQVVAAAAVLAVLLQLFDVDTGGLGGALLVIAVAQGLQLLLQPLFSLVARLFGAVGIVFLGFFAYAIVLWASFRIVPGIEELGLGETLAVAWTYAALVTLLQWIFLTRSDDYFLRSAVRSAQKKPKQETRTPGFVFVQLDGIPWQLLDWQIKAGNLPNIRRLVHDEGYRLRHWHTQIPSTTPASQAGILLGSNDGIPAFRWYERDGDTLVVANQPAGAALIESRLSTGKGLLADGGVSVGNIFSGDAPTNIMVLSKLEGNRESLRSMHEYSAYFSNISGFMRVFILALGEMVKELYQGRRQKLRNETPRIDRSLSYVLLRAGTNVILRDLQTRIVLDKMMGGANSIYVDYLDYDEIAHHAGVARPESLAAVEGLDRVIGTLTRAVEYAPRPYRVVFVSDHGQSQGATFRQLHGTGLAEVVGDLLQTKRVLGLTDPVETQRTPRTLLAEGSAGTGIKSTAMGSAQKKYEQGKAAAPSEDSEVVVTGSGNLGNVWIRSYKRRPTLGDLDRDYPGLVRGLLATEGIGLVLVDSGKGGPVCIGQNGEVRLRDGTVTGDDPLAAYPRFMVSELHKLSTMRNAPDVQIISTYDESTGEVHAFEELVGSHGGIGGWQTDAILLHPPELEIPKKYLRDGELVGSTTIHKIFVDWLHKAGQRKDV